MRTMKQLAMFLVPLFIFTACATTGLKTAGKYNLDNQLEPVSEVLKYNLMSWETIDNQLFILQTSPSQYYLIVLVWPAENLMYTESISISHTGDMVKPGYDKVTVYGAPKSQTYVIDKIYKLKDREEANAVKTQLSGK